jgi:general secretion pathway protein A
VHETYWELQRKPFENTPEPDFFYHSPHHAEAVEQFASFMKEQRGAGLLTGDYGCGKTTVLRVMDELVDYGHHRVAYLDFPRFRRDQLAGEILRSLDEEGGGDDVDRMHRLGELLYQTYDDGGHTFVVVDEAQIISDEGVLEEMRRLLDYQIADEFLVTFLLVGEPALGEKLLRTRLDQQIALRYHLQGFDSSHTGSYISFRMEIAGANRPIFTPDAVELVHEVSHGTPRRINSVCDMCLFLGARRNADEVTADLVRMVA